MSEMMKYPYVYEDGTRIDNAPIDRTSIGTLKDILLPLFTTFPAERFEWIDIKDKTEDKKRTIRIETEYIDSKRIEYLSYVETRDVNLRKTKQSEMKKIYEFLENVDKKKICWYVCRDIQASIKSRYFVLDVTIWLGD